MRLDSRIIDAARAVADIPDGASVMVGGFGVPGTPFTLIRALVDHGARDLTIIKNDANESGMGIDLLLQSGQMARLITSHIGLNANMVAAMNESRVAVEFVPQGILAERIRTGGAGMAAFLSDIGIGTRMAEGKQRVTMPDGRSYLVEPALRADFALIHAAAADGFGNLRFAASARNFNPLMAMAARTTIAEAECVLPLGGLDPDDIHTPGPFVDRVVALPESLPEVYGVVKR
ncbi:CoA transferase subunit A [Paracoccus xiamenensis]|uniref:CoA transferase subunit A n=1 Tax=Paracoccus xiamenensis TaxID=2714901 RepID=UPI00140CCEA4|nr:CoA transferase subunit A [Paracoccus xiamenensis]NHF72359.1 CoA transferase subunit A [Paracoccus xiamenensis]